MSVCADQKRLYLSFQTCCCTQAKGWLQPISSKFMDSFLCMGWLWVFPGIKFGMEFSQTSYSMWMSVHYAVMHISKGVQHIVTQSHVMFSSANYVQLGLGVYAKNNWFIGLQNRESTPKVESSTLKGLTNLGITWQRQCPKSHTVWVGSIFEVTSRLLKNDYEKIFLI